MIRFFLVALGFVVVYVMRDVIAALIFAIIIASAIEPAIQWLGRHRIPRILSVLFIYLAIAALFFLLIYLVVPLFVEDFQKFSTSYPSLERQFVSGLERIRDIPFFSFLELDAKGILNFPTEYLRQVGGGVLNFASNVFGGFFSLLLIVVFSFYLAAQERGIENFLRLVSPVAHEEYILSLWGRSQRKLGRWARAQLLLGAIVGVFTYFGLIFLGVPHAIFLAILAAFLELIPVVGPILSAIPAVAVSLFSSPLLGVWVIVLYTVIQQVESHVIVPMIMKKAVGLNPLVVVLALLAGVKLGGILGILLAVPVAAVLAEFVGDWDKKKRAVMAR